MDMNPRKVGAIILVVLALAFSCVRIAGDNKPTGETTKDVSDSQAVVETINNAKEIRATKSWFTWGDEWTIYANGNEVGKVKGKTWPVLGDTYSLYTTKGNLVGSESENPQIISHKAGIYDWNNQETGHLDAEILTFLAKVQVYHGDTKVGVSQQKFGLTFNTDIKDNNDVTGWKMNRAFFSFTSDLTITKKADTEVTGMDALWVSLMMSEIHDAKSSSDSGSSSRNRSSRH